MHLQYCNQNLVVLVRVLTVHKKCLIDTDTQNNQNMLNRYRYKSIVDTCIYTLPISGCLQYQLRSAGSLTGFTFITNHEAFLVFYEYDICNFKSGVLGDVSFAELTQRKKPNR